MMPNCNLVLPSAPYVLPKSYLHATHVLPTCRLGATDVLPKCCLSAPLGAAYVLSATYVPPNCSHNLPATNAVLPRCHLRTPSVQPNGYLSATSCCQSATKVLPKCYLRASCVLPMRCLSAT